MNKCYSINDEDFIYNDEYEILDYLHDQGLLHEGFEYYEADSVKIDPANVIRVDWLLANADDFIFELIGEHYNYDLSEAPIEAIPIFRSGLLPLAIEELERLIVDWIEKHKLLEKYRVIQGNSRKRYVTEEDVEEYYGENE